MDNEQEILEICKEWTETQEKVGHPIGANPEFTVVTFDRQGDEQYNIRTLVENAYQKGYYAGALRK